MPPTTPACAFERCHASRSSGSSAAYVEKPIIEAMWAASRTAVALTVLERRFALLDEGGHAFLLVLERELRMKDAALEENALGKRRFVGAVDRLLDHHRHRQRVARDLLRHCERLLLQLVHGHDARDEACALGFLRVHRSRREAHVHRFRLAHRARQALRAARAGHDAEVDLGLAELCIVSSDDDDAALLLGQDEFIAHDWLTLAFSCERGIAPGMSMRLRFFSTSVNASTSFIVRRPRTARSWYSFALSRFQVISCSESSRSTRAGMPATSERAGTRASALTKASAATTASSPISALSFTTQFMPISAPRRTTQPCSTAPWPTVTSAPTTVSLPGKPCSMQVSWILAPSSTTMRPKSPRRQAQGPI